MREYKLITEHDTYYLIPSGENPVSHAIRFQALEKAHEYRLSLGLGTHPDPQKAPQAYQRLADDYHGAPLFEVLMDREVPEEELGPGCCRSGCDGCPWAEEQRRLGKL